MELLEFRHRRTARPLQVKRNLWNLKIARQSYQFFSIFKCFLGPLTRHRIWDTLYNIILLFVKYFIPNKIGKAWSLWNLGLLGTLTKIWSAHFLGWSKINFSQNKSALSCSIGLISREKYPNQTESTDSFCQELGERKSFQ